MGNGIPAAVRAFAEWVNEASRSGDYKKGFQAAMEKGDGKTMTHMADWANALTAAAESAGTHLPQVIFLPDKPTREDFDAEVKAYLEKKKLIEAKATAVDTTIEPN